MNETTEKRLKQIIKHNKEIEELNQKNLIIKIFLIILLIFLLSIFKFSFSSLKFYLSLSKKTINYQNILPTEIKNKIITIGFYDVIHCNQRWRRVKKGYFYDLPKYTNKFR
jgi:hypothetical protein